MKIRGPILMMAAAAAAVCLSGDGLGATTHAATTEVVVTLRPPALARFGRSLQSASHTAYARALAAQQARVVSRVEQTIPEAQVRWRYHLVLDGFAVVVPRSELSRLAAVPGVAQVWPSVAYHALDDVSQIGAPQLWGPTLATAGQGEKIGIIDDGVDASHGYFNPAGFTYPAGFPKGQTALATPKVIVQRAFPAPGETWKYADAPFDPVNSGHATHVAGIAAGDHGTKADGVTISGVAPAAWIGNYKALAVPTPGFGLDGNSAELAAAIEAAVADGMNVINLSVGEPEVEPSRDLVVVALDNAARAGVVPVVAAGNDFDEYGFGSITSPGNTPAAITVAAAGSANQIADFSSAGPTPVSLQMKPDVTAPGVSILSSVPKSQGTWDRISGTSMASPHVAGAVALLLQRHPEWTVAQVKSALVQTGDPARTGAAEAAATREGGGMIDLPRADDPLLFASPATLSFGQLPLGGTASRTVQLTDAGGGGTWTVAGRGVAVAPTVTVPGTLTVTAHASGSPGDVSGFVVLTRGTDTRRIPFWFGVSAHRLASESVVAIRGGGTYSGTTRNAPRRVTTYRYPTAVPSYPGPERVFRVQVTGALANFGVHVLTGHVSPHIAFAGSEDHLAGLTALPTDVNPYRTTYGKSVPASGVDLPARGAYDLVFDTRSTRAAGPFSFRYWVNDTTPPTLRIVSTRGRIVVRATDAGSGVDPSSFTATVDGAAARWAYHDGALTIGAATGRHRVVVSAADWQETKNMEDVPPVLPNTATLRATVTVR